MKERRMNFIIVPRELFADTAFPPEPFSRREAFLDLVQRAAIEEKVIPVNGGTITLKRGQVYASVRFLAKRWEWSKSKVERFIKDLQSWGFVGQRATQKWDTLRDTNGDTLTSVISIVNYDAFQGAWDTSRDTNEDTKRDTNEDKYNKEIKKEIKKTSKDVKERFVKPSVADVNAYCLENSYDINADDFINYYDSVGWRIGKSGKPMKDWKAAVRTWVAKRKKDQSESSSLFEKQDDTFLVEGRTYDRYSFEQHKDIFVKLGFEEREHIKQGRRLKYENGRFVII